MGWWAAANPSSAPHERTRARIMSTPNDIDVLGSWIVHREQGAEPGSLGRSRSPKCSAEPWSPRESVQGR
jgi:hypothetical protein